MFKSLCFIFYFIFISSLWSKPKDSLNNYRLKGIDISFGGINNNIGERANINLLKAITPEGNRARFNYDNASANEATITPVRICLGIVFGNNQRNSKYFVNKHELIFKFSFETYRSQNRYYNIHFLLNPDIIDTAKFNYTYQTQTIGLGYQLCTKAFLKNFALFGGANVDFGMVAFKRIDGPRYNHMYPDIIDVKNYNTTILRGNAMLGLKYNFSCDINFFLQAEFGILHYGKDIGTNATYGGASFGIRYKFLEDQDKLKYKNESFW